MASHVEMFACVLDAAVLLQEQERCRKPINEYKSETLT